MPKIRRDLGARRLVEPALPVSERISLVVGSGLASTANDSKLTSAGDERPCLRCIKRGLQDQCHDGVRKKAKYLHDAPPEALIPGFAGHYHHANGAPHVSAAPNQISTNGLGMPQSGNFMSPQSAGYQPYTQPSQISPAMIEGNDMASLPAQQNNGTPRFASIPCQNISPSNVPGVIDPSTTMGPPSNHSFDSAYIDPSDPSLFNFNLNLSELNFGNHYGALEFGMLGHMSAGAMGTPDVEAMNTLGGQSHHGSLSYESGNGFSPANNFGFNQGFTSWQNVPNSATRHGSVTNIWSQNNGMDAFAIGELAGQSPHSQNQDNTNGLSSPENQFNQPDQDLLRHSFNQTQLTRKRRRDASDIYTSVTAPHGYTQGFHALTAFLQKRYPTNKRLRIAKALASIRPSFISCNKSLNHDDLIFMEKCFQRTLWEYEDFIGRYGTPTIICRRTGEVAAASKEFSLVTGWRRDVLLGKEANLNVNTGRRPGSGTHTGNTSRGAVTPRISNVELDAGRPQPVFLAELMDEDSVVQFYEDFAELAFGASRAAIVGQPVSLLKYKTKQDPGWEDAESCSDDRAVKREVRAESGVLALGDKDGRVPCQVCWTVKRDTFDIPMLIVMNVSQSRSL